MDTNPNGQPRPNRRRRSVIATIVMSFAGLLAMAGLQALPAAAQSGGPVDPGSNAPQVAIRILNDSGDNRTFVITGMNGPAPAIHLRPQRSYTYGYARPGANLRLEVRNERNEVIMSHSGRVPNTATSSNACTFHAWERASFYCGPN